MPFVENQGAKLYWDEQGSGEPLLLIMGIPRLLETLAVGSEGRIR
jgi:hypothetical protein